MIARQTRFVADGYERLQRSPESREQRAIVEAENRARREGELAATSGFWKRLKLRWQIRRQEKCGSLYKLWISR